MEINDMNIIILAEKYAMLISDKEKEKEAIETALREMENRE